MRSLINTALSMMWFNEEKTGLPVEEAVGMSLAEISNVLNLFANEETILSSYVITVNDYVCWLEEN